MDQQNKHRRRVSFSDVAPEKPKDSTRRKSNTTKSESFRGGNNTNAKDYYDGKESEFATTLAAAAYAIYSLEKTRAEYERLMVDSFREVPLTRSKSSRRDEGNSTFELPDSRRVSRGASSLGDRGDDDVTTDRRPIEIRGLRTVERGVSQREEETRADAWERARMEKIHKWYEKMNGKILEWENEKKKIALLNKERRKEELERLKRVNLHHYQNKMDWIESVSGGARKQLEEKKRREEAYAKERAKKIRSTGRVPVRCLCLEY